MFAARQIAFGDRKRLPYDAEIEYLESTGTQWIDTGWIPTTTAKITLGVNIQDYTTSTRVIQMGCIQSGGKPYYNWSWSGFFGDLYCHWYFGNHTDSSYVDKFTSICNIGERVDTILTYDGSGIASANGEEFYCTSANIVPQCSFYLFLRNNNNQPDYQLTGRTRCFRFKVEDNGEIVHDFIPVRIGNIGYMYDKVSGKLFGNMGTGDFVLGRDLIDYTAKDYIQDGLVSMYDGIQNSPNYTHEDIASTDEFYNLITKQYDFGGGEFVSTTNGYKVITQPIIPRLNSYTAEWTKAHANGNGEWTVNAVFYSTSPATAVYGNIFCFANSYMTLGYNTNNKHIATTNVGGWKKIEGEIANVARVVTLTKLDSENYVLYAGDGSKKLEFTTNQEMSEGFAFRGNIDSILHGFRFYNRALTADEISHNYAVDRVRFGL